MTSKPTLRQTRRLPRTIMSKILVKAKTNNNPNNPLRTP